MTPARQSINQSIVTEPMVVEHDWYLLVIRAQAAVLGVAGCWQQLRLMWISGVRWMRVSVRGRLKALQHNKRFNWLTAQRHSNTAAIMGDDHPGHSWEADPAAKVTLTLVTLMSELCMLQPALWGAVMQAGHSP